MRREYAVIGGPVNMAARLMGVGSYDVVVDEKTKIESENNFEFETLPRT